MERSEYILFITFIFFLVTLPISGQSNYKQQIYNAYITGDMDKWEQVMAEMENTIPAGSGDAVDLLNYYYGYTGYLIGSKRNKEADTYIKKAEKLIDQLLASHPAQANLYAYKGSFAGFKMALNKLKAPKLGPQSIKYIQKAWELNPADIQVLADRGNMLYYAPRLFGGNKKEGMESIKEAIRQMEINNRDTGNWHYLNLLTSLARYYEEAGDKATAIELYEKILRIEPQYEWVKNELYPGAQM